MSEKLLPCPFCGEKARLMQYGEQEYIPTCNECDCVLDYCFYSAEEAIAAWNRRANHIREVTKKVPLTLDELRQMDGEPVYVVTLDNPLENQPYWAIAGINSNDSRHQNGVALYNRVQGDWGALDLYGDTWLAYRTKPERSEG